MLQQTGLTFLDSKNLYEINFIYENNSLKIDIIDSVDGQIPSRVELTNEQVFLLSQFLKNLSYEYHNADEWKEVKINEI